MSQTNYFFNEERYRKCVAVEPPTGLLPPSPSGRPPGSIQLANLTGAGTVDLIQLGLGPIDPSGPGETGAKVMLDSLLRIHIDGAPPLETDLGTFFVAHCETDVWACDRLGVTGFNHRDWSGCSYFRRVMIPYNVGCVIELVNRSPVSSAAVYSQVYYYEGRTPERLTGSRRHRFRWQWTPFTRVTPFQRKELLDITGRGVVDSIQLITAGPIPPNYPPDPNQLCLFPPVWLEGNPEFTIDGGLGDWHSGGTEDFFGTQGYGVGLHQTTDSWGMPTRKPIGCDPPLDCDQPQNRTTRCDQFCVTMYRFFDRDPVIFNRSCQFTFANGQRGQGPGDPPPEPPEVNVTALVTYYLDR
jgi:hypothetical protein